MLGYCVDAAAFKGINREYIRFTPKPGNLTLGELSRCDEGTVSTFLKVVFPRKMRPDLSISNRPHCGRVTCKSGPLHQCLDLVQESVSKHPVQPFFNAIMQFLSRRRLQDNLDEFDVDYRRFR
jgi:hypothetical protein